MSRTNAADDELTPSEKVFVAAYATDPSSPTFSNAVQSAIAAGHGKLGAPVDSKEYGAAARASRCLSQRPRVRTAIDRILREHNLTVKDRAAALSDILHSPSIETINTSFDSEGNLTSKQIVQSKANRDRLHAIDMLNRMDGTYTRNAAVASIQARALEPLLKDWGKRLRDSLQEKWHSQDVPTDPADYTLPRADSGPVDDASTIDDTTTQNAGSTA